MSHEHETPESEFVRKWKHDGNATMIQAVQIIATLTAERDTYLKRLNISPQGDDEIDALESCIGWLRHDIEVLTADRDALRTALEEADAFWIGCGHSVRGCNCRAEVRERMQLSLGGKS